MSEKQRFYTLFSIMIAICLVIALTSFGILYKTALNEEKARLVETVESQAHLIEAVGNFDSIYSNDYPGGSVQATLSQIMEAHKNYMGFGKTGEFTLAKRQGDNIVFILSHRHYDLDTPRPVPFDSKLAEPMRRALSGKSGTVIGLDYRGKKVLAAYEPVKWMGGVGIVAKIDFAEIRAPFINAALIVFGIMVLLVTIGAAFFFRISSPFIRALEEKNRELSNEIETRNKLEESLRAGEKKYRSLFENMLNGFALHRIILDSDAQPVDYEFLEVNDAFEKLTGLKKENIIGKKVTEVIPGIEKDPADWIQRYGEVALTGRNARFENFSAGLGKYFSIQAFSQQNGQFVTIFEDITERKHAERRINHLNSVLRSIRDINQLIVREHDPDTLIREGCRILVMNRGYLSALLIQTDKNGMPLSWAAAGVAASDGRLTAMLEEHELPLCCKDASNTIVRLISNRDSLCTECHIAGICAQVNSLHAKLIHGGNNFGHLVVALDRDLSVDDDEQGLFREMACDIAYALSFLQAETEHVKNEERRKSLEHQLFQAQKMESVGRLAGGVAHDFNNMLGIMIGYTDMAMEQVKPEDQLYSDLKEIRDAAERSKEITMQLLAFARKQTIEPKVIDLNKTIANMLKLLQRLIGEDIQLIWLPGEKTWNIEIDPAQIDQMLANLCVNARDAIGEHGSVTIETQNVHLDSDYCQLHAGCTPGDYVMLSVSDDGCGMAPEILDNVFEPFFTTKEMGRGTGLGLATVYGIVKQNNGYINAYSEPGKGTTLKIYLPSLTDVEVEIPRQFSEKTTVGGSETIMLVEDDKVLLNLYRKMLENLGYKVLTVNSSPDALKTAEEYPARINLLMTDVIMPDLNGRELAEQLQNIRPDLKVLFVSGYTSDVISRRGMLGQDVTFISKPFSKKALAAKIRETLGDADA